MKRVLKTWSYFSSWLYITWKDVYCFYPKSSMIHYSSTLVWSTVPCSQTSAFLSEQVFGQWCLPSPPSPKVRSLCRYGKRIWDLVLSHLSAALQRWISHVDAPHAALGSFSPAFHASSPNATHHGLLLTTLAASAAPSCSQTRSSLCRASCSPSIHTVLRHSISVKISRQMSAGI